MRVQLSLQLTHWAGFQTTAGQFYFSHISPMWKILIHPFFKVSGMGAIPHATATLQCTAKAATQPLPCHPNYSNGCQTQSQSVIDHISNSLNGPIDLKM